MYVSSMSRPLLRTVVRKALRADADTKGVRGLAWRAISKMLDLAIPKNESGNNSSVR